MPVPVPGNNEVLIKVSACGICRTDLHVVEGELAQRRRNVIPGHQIVGTVAAVGRICRRFRCRAESGRSLAAQDGWDL